MSKMSCCITLITDQGNTAGIRELSITNETNIMAQVYDFRSYYTDSEHIVRTVIDIALHPLGQSQAKTECRTENYGMVKKQLGYEEKDGD